MAYGGGTYRTPVSRSYTARRQREPRTTATNMATTTNAATTTTTTTTTSPLRSSEPRVPVTQPKINPNHQTVPVMSTTRGSRCERPPTYVM